MIPPIRHCLAHNCTLERREAQAFCAQHWALLEVRSQTRILMTGRGVDLGEARAALREAVRELARTAGGMNTMSASVPTEK